MEPRNRSRGIDSASLQYVTWRAGTTNRVVVTGRQDGNRFLGSLKGLQIRSRSPVSKMQGVWGILDEENRARGWVEKVYN
jgi:hypothetical protein